MDKPSLKDTKEEASAIIAGREFHTGTVRGKKLNLKELEDVVNCLNFLCCSASTQFHNQKLVCWDVHEVVDNFEIKKCVLDLRDSRLSHCRCWSMDETLLVFVYLCVITGQLFSEPFLSSLSDPCGRGSTQSSSIRCWIWPYWSRLQILLLCFQTSSYPQESQHAVCFLCISIYMALPWEWWLNVYTQEFRRCPDVPVYVLWAWIFSLHKIAFAFLNQTVGRSGLNLATRVTVGRCFTLFSRRPMICSLKHQSYNFSFIVRHFLGFGDWYSQPTAGRTSAGKATVSRWSPDSF